MLERQLIHEAATSRTMREGLLQFSKKTLLFYGLEFFELHNYVISRR